MLKLIVSDLYRYHGKTSFASFISSFFLIEGFRYSLFLRVLSHLSKKKPLYYLVFVIKRYYGYKYGFQIFTKRIGAGLYIGHFGTVIINENASIGNNVNLSPGVVIGQVSRGKLKGVPIIGDNVWIGSNSIIVGNIRIGNDVLIAPGSYVTFDVPSFSVVRGNPAVIEKSRGVNGYICNKWTI